MSNRLNRAGANPRERGCRAQHPSGLRRRRGHRRVRRSDRLRRCGISLAAVDRCVSVCSAASGDPQQGNEPRCRRFRFAVPRVAVPLAGVATDWPIIVNLLAGSLLGAWFGASWATRLASHTLYRVIAVLLLGIAVVLALGHDATASGAMLTGAAQMAAGVVAGFVIGIVAALLGVAGGELLIPTLVLLFGADIKLAGSLSLAVSLPTMLVG